MRAKWNGTEIASGDDTVVVEGNHYFLLEDVGNDYLRKSEKTSYCPWKGTANYYDIVVGDGINVDAAWYYAQPKSRAEKIAGRIAFWRGVEVSE